MSAETPTPARLLELVDRLAGQAVVSWVDLVADRFIAGAPKRISREAPVLILRYEGEIMTPGGGANAVNNIAALGGRPLPLGVVGEDPSGEALLEHFETSGITTEGILRRPDYLTPTKTRILGGARHTIKQQIVRYDVEDELVLSAEDRAALLAKVEAWAGEAAAAVFSDYGYGAVDPTLLPEVRRRLGSKPILADSRYRLGEFTIPTGTAANGPGLDGATPNAEEAEALLGRPFESDLAPAGQTLRRRLGARFLLITLGSDGMALVEGHRMTLLPVHGTDQVADVTGAGDTVIGAFVLALAAGATPLEAACLANYAGGVVVMKMGTATLGPDELRSAIELDPQLLGRLERLEQGAAEKA